MGSPLLKIKPATVMSMQSEAYGSCFVPMRVSWYMVGGGVRAASQLFLLQWDKELPMEADPEIDGGSSCGHLS